MLHDVDEQPERVLLVHEQKGDGDDAVEALEIVLNALLALDFHFLGKREMAKVIYETNLHR